MLCSEREMGISDEHEGIIELDPNAEIGAGFAKLAGLDDPIIDIAITPDRADCLGVRGIARDLAAAGLGALKPLDTSPVQGTFKSPINWQVSLPDEEPALAPYVVGRFFKGVKNVPSPQWLKDRLIAVGLRPISALVDITNYVMLDLGRPLHAYDADKIKGDICIRLAKTDEKYLALDGKEYMFGDDMIVIGDDDGVVVVPKQAAETIVAFAEEYEDVEAHILDKVQSEGVSPGTYYPPSEEFIEQFRLKQSNKS